jgi:hypothetical protein
MQKALCNGINDVWAFAGVSADLIRVKAIKACAPQIGGMRQFVAVAHFGAQLLRERNGWKC